MSEQNFENHTQIVPLFHFGVYGLLTAVLIGSVINLVHSTKENLYSASLLVAVAVVLIALAFYARLFALKAQDRAIRAEENLRHFILTGKPLNSHLRLSQIIALRFASDEEFVDLAYRAAHDAMRSKEIKEAIKNWRADHHRV